jgi:hypothetical protein
MGINTEAMTMSRNDTTPTLDQVRAFQEMFAHFNGTLFAGALPAAFLNFSRYSKKTLAFYAPRRRTNGSETTVIDEISLTSPPRQRHGAARPRGRVRAPDGAPVVHLWCTCG